LKKSEVRGRLASAKGKMFQLLGSLGAQENPDCNASSLNPILSDAACPPENWIPDFAEWKRARADAELKKSQAIEYWRRWMDQPK